MPYYRDFPKTKLEATDKIDFSEQYLSGQDVEYTGIYRCESCGYETVVKRGENLPLATFCGEHDPELWQPPPVQGITAPFWILVIAARDDLHLLERP
jgi:hypothetical protein